jgi:pimeloyl-ACP methyl ester carboxylesterase/DNA-binding SARP family transcriptional activator
VAVTIRVLGGFGVDVDDRPVLPGLWSRRHAAGLVKLLALTRGHALRREQVIDALWPEESVDVAAPKLHKAAHFARRALSCPEGIVLRGDMVALLPGRPVTVDAFVFEEAAERAMAHGGVEAALSALDRCGGELLPEDLYEPWTADWRERLRLRRLQLMRQARRWDDVLELHATDEGAHLALMRAHVAAGDRSAALRQYERWDTALREEGATAPPAAERLRAELVEALTTLGPVTPAEHARIEQQIRFARTADGVNLAYAVTGGGVPLVKVANWMTHIDHDWHSPVWRHWLIEMSRRFQLIRYDERGCGLSDWEVPEQSFEMWVHDLETVVDTVGLDRFPLMGLSQGGAVAVVYAARHPERVSHLVIYGSYAQGRKTRARSAEEIRMHELEVALARLGWGLDSPALRQVFTMQFMPEASRELWDNFNELQRLTTSAENAARVLQLAGTIDIVDLARQVQAPTLVLHARADGRPPFEQGRLLASLIPGSRFVALDSSNHILLEDEPAWPHFLTEVENFVGPEVRG